MTERTRSAGTKTSLATVLTLPVPLRPAVSQSSRSSSSTVGTSATTGAGTPSGVVDIAAITLHWLCHAPDWKCHEPLRTKPSPRRSALPVGLKVPLTRTSGVVNTSS